MNRLTIVLLGACFCAPFLSGCSYDDDHDHWRDHHRDEVRRHDERRYDEAAYHRGYDDRPVEVERY